MLFRSPERGSFEFDINLLRDAIGLAFGNSEVARYTAIVGKTVVGLFKLHSFLGGEDPASVEVDSSNSQVFNNTGDVIIVDNSVRQTYVESDAVRKNLDDTYRATRGDERIEGIEIESEDDPDNVFQAECETFDQLAGIERESKEGEERTIVDRLTLTIISVVFDPDRKWEFLYEGRKITAKISDAGFWFRVKGHKEDFRQGDRMDVDLERVQTYNPKLRDWVTDEHEVIKVHDRFRASPQLLMFGDTDE